MNPGQQVMHHACYAAYSVQTSYTLNVPLVDRPFHGSHRSTSASTAWHISLEFDSRLWNFKVFRFFLDVYIPYITMGCSQILNALHAVGGEVARRQP